MYQSLHDNVSHLLEEDNLHLNFHKNDNNKTYIKEYNINIMSQFICYNLTCDFNE